jgi:hypothetical protein
MWMMVFRGLLCWDELHKDIADASVLEALLVVRTQAVVNQILELNVSQNDGLKYTKEGCCCWRRVDNSDPNTMQGTWFDVADCSFET